MRVQVCLCLAALRAAHAADNENNNGNGFDLNEFTNFFDEDKDGKVSLAEVKAGILDTNSDDDESKDPMMLIQESAATFEATEALFKQADLDGDGSLSQSEIEISEDFQNHILSSVQNMEQEDDEEEEEDKDEEDDEDEDEEDAPGDVSAFDNEAFHNFFDRNKDGQISLAEVEAGLVEANLAQDPEFQKEHEAQAQAQDTALVQEGQGEEKHEDSGYMAAIRAVFEVADTDKDGVVTAAELKNPEVFKPGFDGSEFLEYFDTNSDGSTTLEEIQGKLENEDEELESQDPRLQSALLEELDATKTAFDLADSNKDGLLSGDEIDKSDPFKQHILDSTGELEETDDLDLGDDLYDDDDDDVDEADADDSDGLEDDDESSDDDTDAGSMQELMAEAEGLSSDGVSDGLEDLSGDDDLAGDSLGLTEQAPQDESLQGDLATLANDVKEVEKLSDSGSA